MENIYNLSVEMIEAQPNDSIVLSLTNKFQELIEVNDKFSFTSSRHYFKNKKVKSIYADIDNLLLNRFGIYYKHLQGEYTAYAISTAPPANFNIIKPAADWYYEYVKNFFDKKNVKEEEIKVIDDLTFNNSDTNDRLYRWKEAVRNLDKTLDTSDVKIDLHKAKVSGLPKEYVLFLVADPYTLINVFELTPREITAILLHEVGHGFTHLEYSYRTVRTTSVLIDTLHDNISNKNKSFKSTLKLIYEESLNGDPKDIEDKSTAIAMLKVIDKYIGATIDLNSTNHSYSDSEQLADQFSGKFGLSKELGTSLIKFGKYKENLSPITVISSLLLNIIFITIMTIILTGGGLLIGIGGTVLYYSITTIMKFITSYITDSGTNEKHTYDNDKRRIIRARNELVRQIRNINMSKKEKSAILSNIDELTDIINSLPDPKDSIGFIDKLAISISTNAKRNIRLRETEEVIEDMMANSLYVSSLKLKQKIGENDG